MPTGREDVLRAVDVVELVDEGGEHPLPGLALFAEEAVGLHEVGVARGGSGELGEAPARDPPVGDHRHVPAHAVARLHHLRAGWERW